MFVGGEHGEGSSRGLRKGQKLEGEPEENGKESFE